MKRVITFAVSFEIDDSIFKQPTRKGSFVMGNQDPQIFEEMILPAVAGTVARKALESFTFYVKDAEIFDVQSIMSAAYDPKDQP